MMEVVIRLKENSQPIIELEEMLGPAFITGTFARFLLFATIF